MLLRRLAGFYMPGGDLSSFEARYSFFVSAAWSIFWIFSFLFFVTFLLGGAYSTVFSLACLIFLFFSTALLLLVFLFRYPLQDLQKATTWGDMCGSRRQRMVQQLLSSRANASVKKYVLHYKGFLKYWRSKGIIVPLPCDSLLISEYLSTVSPGYQKFIRCSLLGLFCFEVGARYHSPRSPR